MKLLHRIQSQLELSARHSHTGQQTNAAGLTRSLRACVVVCAGLAAVASVSTMSGCIIVARGDSSSWDSMHTETRTTTIPVKAGTKVNAKTNNGSVTIASTEDSADATVASSGSSPSTATAVATITATIRARSDERLEKVLVVSSLDVDGTLQVRVEWPSGRRYSDEGCSLNITLPKPGAVKVETSNGAITVRDIGESDADLDTSNGRITVEKSAGKVKADTSNGAVQLSGVREAEVSTSNGRISVALRDDATGPVDLDTSNGAVELTVGSAFAGNLDARTSNGAINSTFHTNVQATSSSKNRASWRFGNGSSPSSSIETSNGRIEVIQAAVK